MTFKVLIGSTRPSDHGPLGAALERQGIELDVFSDGVATLEAARQRTADLVLVDLHLSGLHGIEVARSLPEVRTSILVDEEEPGIADLKQLGLEVVVRPRGGADSLADDIARRLKGLDRMAADAEALDEGGDLRRRLVDLAGGDEDLLLRTVLEDPETHLLTGGYLRGWRIEEEWLRGNAAGAPVSVVFVALDDAEAILRRHGPDAFRQAEGRVAGVLLTELEGTDLPARDAPGRYLVLMPGTDARSAAERVFRACEELEDVEIDGNGGPFKCVLAVGVAAAPDGFIDSAGELLTRAEEALEAALRLGGGRVCQWQGVRELSRKELTG